MGSLKATLTSSGRGTVFDTLDSLLVLYWNPSGQRSLLYWEKAGALPLLCYLLSSSLLCSSILLIN